MSRVLSIQQSEPGLYVVNVQRSALNSIGKILESIAHPPIEDDDDRSRMGANGLHRDVEEIPRYGVAGSKLFAGWRRPNRER